MLRSISVVSAAAVRHHSHTITRVAVGAAVGASLQSTPTNAITTSNTACVVRRRWMSSSTTTTTTPTTTTTTTKEPQIYTWGTDHKGSLLQPTTILDGKSADTPTHLTDWKTSLSFVDGSGAPVSMNDDSDSTCDNVIIKEIVGGATETAILLSDGRCFVCGENKQGQLGLGHKNPVDKLTLLELPLGEDNQPVAIASIALGSTFSAAIDANGDLYSFGYGGSTLGDGLGFLGHGDGSSYLTPKLVESVVEDGVFAQKVTVGTSHMCVLTTEGEVLTCGAGSYGRLGNLETHEDQLYLEPVEMLRSGVLDISGGNDFTMALNDDGVVYGWGRGDKGQLGTGFGLAVDMYAMASVPEPIEADELLGRKVIKVASGASHAICITEGGEVFQWGMTLFLEPVRVSELLHTKIVDVACGDNYSLALDENGQVYSWGQGKTGVLGQGSVTKLNQAQPIEALEDKKITSLSAGRQHVACFAEDI